MQNFPLIAVKSSNYNSINLTDLNQHDASDSSDFDSLKNDGALQRLSQLSITPPSKRINPFKLEIRSPSSGFGNNNCLLESASISELLPLRNPGNSQFSIESSFDTDVSLVLKADKSSSSAPRTRKKISSTPLKALSLPRFTPVPLSQAAKSRYLCAVGYMVVYYNFSLINSAKILMHTRHGNPSAFQEGILTSASLAGAVIGQLFLAPVADSIGRKKASLISGALSVAGALMATVIHPKHNQPSSIYPLLSAARFILGIGAGAEYPILSSITIENSTVEERSDAATTNCLMLYLGYTLAQALYMTLIPTTSDEFAWRGVTAIGALLSLSMLVAKSFVFEEDSAKFQNGVHTGANTPDKVSTNSSDSDYKLTDHFDESPSAQARINHFELPVIEPLRNPTKNTLPDSLGVKLAKLWKPLLATSGCWMLYDYINYSLNLYSAEILGKSSQPEQGATMALLTTLASITGTLIAKRIVKMDLIDRKKLQLAGFTGITLIHGALALGSNRLWPDVLSKDGTRDVTPKNLLAQASFISLYLAQEIFDSGGVYVSVSLIPSEIFPTNIKSTCLGIATAAGNVGSVLGSVSMPFIRETGGLKLVFSSTSALGTLATLLSYSLLPNYDYKQLSNLEEVYASKGEEGVLELLFQDESRAGILADRV